MPCATWPTLVTRSLVSTGPSGPKKLGKSLTQGSGVWAGSQTRYSDLLFCPEASQAWTLLLQRWG